MKTNKQIIHALHMAYIYINIEHDIYGKVDMKDVAEGLAEIKKILKIK